MQIKVMPFLRRKGNRVGKAAIEFNSGVLTGFQLTGFTIIDDKEKGLYVMFPSSIVRRNEHVRPYFFLHTYDADGLNRLQDAILDIYESMTAFTNRPRVAMATPSVADESDE